MATSACEKGHVKIGGQSVKPARAIKPGDIIEAVSNGLNRIVKVVSPVDRRVGAPRVAEFMEDLTPASEFQKKREPQARSRPKGAGRPTKRDRRVMQSFFQ